jgi:hypothetical protein
MSKVKATLRIPTKDPYAFIELQVEEEPELIVTAYKAMYDSVNKPNEISENAFYDKLVGIMNNDLSLVKRDDDEVVCYLTTDELPKLSKGQDDVIQAIKRFKKRLPKEDDN